MYLPKPTFYFQSDSSSVERKTIGLLVMEDLRNNVRPLMNCNSCEYVTSHSGHYKTHVKRHSGEKPHKCSQCRYAAYDKGDVRKHYGGTHWRETS